MPSWLPSTGSSLNSPGDELDDIIRISEEIEKSTRRISQRVRAFARKAHAAGKRKTDRRQDRCSSRQCQQVPQRRCLRPIRRSCAHSTFFGRVIGADAVGKTRQPPSQLSAATHCGHADSHGQPRTRIYSEWLGTGDTRSWAMRSLERHLARVVYTRLKREQPVAATGTIAVVAL